MYLFTLSHPTITRD